MGVDLLFEFHVTELRLVRLTALGTQHGTCDQGVINHKYDRIEDYLDQQRDDPQLQELPCGERAIEGERQVQPRNKRHAGRREQHEQKEGRDFGDRAVSGFTPARMPDIDDIDAQQDNQCRGVRNQQVGHVVEAVCGKGGRGEKLDIGQPQHENHPHGQQQQPDAGRPGRGAARRVVAAAEQLGEPHDAPAQDLGGDEGRDGMHHGRGVL